MTVPSNGATIPGVGWHPLNFVRHLHRSYRYRFHQVATHPPESPVRQSWNGLRKITMGESGMVALHFRQSRQAGIIRTSYSKANATARALYARSQVREACRTRLRAISLGKLLQRSAPRGRPKIIHRMVRAAIALPRRPTPIAGRPLALGPLGFNRTQVAS